MRHLEETMKPSAGRSRRRDFIRRAGIISASGPALLGPNTADAASSEANVYQRLAVPTLIHAQGYTTALGGSLMPAEVRRAMDEASRYFVRLEDLQRKVGERLAQITGAEFAIVTSGAASAIALGTASCMTGKDPAKIKRLPDTADMKSDVIIQKNHRNPFDHAARSTGARLLEVETMEEYQAAFNPKTAMVLHLASEHLSGSRGPGKIPFAQVLAVAHEYKIPVMVDAAPELPPVSNLSHFTRLGADLVCFSGGKGLLGPQCSGMLVGRRELVEAAWLNHMAGSDTIGRQMKIGKEEIVGLLAAVERFVRFNHDEEERRWTKMLQRVARRLSGIRSVEARFVPEDIEPPHVPRLYVRWDEQAFGLTAQQVIRELAEGDPHIYVRHTTYGLTIVPVGIQAGEEETIARRLRQILLSSSNRLRPSSMV
jgi:L-seryl-tRNA(Ser) seleniumtransferase